LIEQGEKGGIEQTKKRREEYQKVNKTTNQVGGVSDKCKHKRIKERREKEETRPKIGDHGKKKPTPKTRGEQKELNDKKKAKRKSTYHKRQNRDTGGKRKEQKPHTKKREKANSKEGKWS